MASGKVAIPGESGQAADRRPSPLLSSNNPFRNRVGSGGSRPPSPALPDQQNQGRPISTNPFLDVNELGADQATTFTTAIMPQTNGSKSATKAGASDNTKELFANLNMDDKNTSTRHAGPPPTNGASRRPENMPPRPVGHGPPPGHRPSQSEEERKRNGARPRGGAGDQLDIFADPQPVRRPHDRRPRRNSDTSVRDLNSTPLDPDREKRRQDRKRKEKRKATKAPSKRLDIIDKLDVSSIFGTGLFHHDGPFDACNPNRNRKGSRVAPMQAFPKDSKNMSMGGGYGPNNSKLNLEQIHGTSQEAHVDFSSGAVAEGYADYSRRPNPGLSSSFNPVDPVEPVHGEETAGLGTSTFLEGAPASRAAIQRRATDDEFTEAANGGLGRKKSLAQKIRSVRPGGARMISPEPTAGTLTSPLGTDRSDMNNNSFFEDYDKEYEKKGAQIEAAEVKAGRVRAPSSPRRGLGLERTKTAESTGGEDGKIGGGFLSRVKSLKGGPMRKGRGDRRDASG